MEKQPTKQTESAKSTPDLYKHESPEKKGSIFQRKMDAIFELYDIGEKDMIPRKEVMEFALEMERILRFNDRKKGDSWKRMDVSDLIGLLDHEWNEWADGHVPEELIDVANLAMMIWKRSSE